MNVTLGLKLDPRVVPRSWQFMIKWSDDPIRWLHEWEISCGRSLGQTSQWTDLLRRKQRFETKCVETKSWTGDWRNLMWYIQQRNSWHMWWPCYTNCTSSSNLIGFITFTWLWTFEAPAKHTPPKPPKPPKPPNPPHHPSYSTQVTFFFSFAQVMPRNHKYLQNSSTSVTRRRPCSRHYWLPSSPA